ncbi:MAG: hypothetical protein ACYDH9_22420 [Limisphaerales bacterium]
MASQAPDLKLDKISIWTAVLGGVAAILIGAFGSLTAGVAAGFGTLLLSVCVEIRIDQAKRSRAQRDSFAKLLKESRPQMLSDYEVLISQPCPVFREMALQKFKEITACMARLKQDVIELHDLKEVYNLLRYAFVKAEGIAEIAACSHGELSEWVPRKDGEDSDWWPMNYIKLHDGAHKAGRKLSRIFVFEPGDAQLVSEVCRNQQAHHVSPKVAPAHQVSRDDIARAGNCIIFYTEGRRPVYCLVAEHSKNGQFEKASFYRDESRIKAVVEAYSRIANVAVEP